MPGLPLLLSITLTVFTAADLVPALKSVIAPFERDSHAHVTIVPGSTGTLTQQIRNGAPADLFFAANEAAIDDLSRDGLVDMRSRFVYARGTLVLASLASRAQHVERLGDLVNDAVRRIAIANPAHAPYGLAAQQALERAGLWERLKPKLIYGENVQQALQYVQSGSADVGIVARSLMGAGVTPGPKGPGLHAVGPGLRADGSAVRADGLQWTVVDPAAYPPLNQAAAMLRRTSVRDLAMAFLDLVKSSSGREALKQFGFLVPGEDF